jgi:hypothetical protein
LIEVVLSVSNASKYPLAAFEHTSFYKYQSNVNYRYTLSLINEHTLKKIALVGSTKSK